MLGLIVFFLIIAALSRSLFRRPMFFYPFGLFGGWYHRPHGPMMGPGPMNGPMERGPMGGGMGHGPMGGPRF